MRKILLSSNDHVGSQMAGPGIRYYHLARELAARFDVTLKVPNRPDEIDLPGVTVVQTERNRYRQWLELAPGFDAVVAQGGLEAPLMAYFAKRRRPRIIYDLYVPFSEPLSFLANRSNGPDRAAAELRARAAHDRLALRSGDAFLCASDRQRAVLLGALHALGRIRLEDFQANSRLSTLVATVPFGLPEEPPVKRRAVLRGVVPEIGERDRILLWGGAIWNWTDPLTLIDAVARLRRERDDVKLYFLGLRHPNAFTPAMEMASRAIELADSLGVRDTHVFFNEGWVPYDERDDYLLEADVGVSLHFDSVETDFAYRTRLLDYIWAELPVLTTRGDVLGDLVERRSLGRSIVARDVDACAAAIVKLTQDEERARLRRNLAQLRPELSWARAAEPVVRLLETVDRNPPPARQVAAEALRYGWWRTRSGRRRRRD